MKLAIISDIHANLEALTAALRAIEQRGVDAVYCLGDIVGYGADPGPCVDLVRSACAGVVLGNHDAAVALDTEVDYLPRDGQKAARLHQKLLTEDQLSYLATLPYTLVAEGSTFVHASPQTPEHWQRLDTFMAATAQFDHFATDVCFIGHTHLPGVMANRLGVFQVRPGHRYLINVGSVGQPRDHNPRLCVGFFDTDTFAYELVRLPYDIERAAARIKKAGLPRSLARRLHAGE